MRRVQIGQNLLLPMRQFADGSNGVVASRSITFDYSTRGSHEQRRVLLRIEEIL